MNREQAIKIIKDCKEKSFKRTLYTLDEYYEAIDMAIKALEQQPCDVSKLTQKAYEDGKKDGYVQAKAEQQPCEDEELDFVQPHEKIKVNLVPCEDAIRREAAIDAMYHHFCDKSREECAQILHEVPSVNPQANKEDIHREREQAYMCGYEDASRKYRIEPCEDAISRQAAIDAAIEAADDWDGGGNRSRAEIIAKALEQLPSVSTEKTGRWIRVTDKTGHLVWECDKCSWQQKFNTNFCPDCGEKMGESEVQDG